MFLLFQNHIYKNTFPFLLLTSHVATGAFGFVLGIYMLPLMIEPPAPDDNEVKAMAEQAQYKAQFRRDLKDSD